MADWRDSSGGYVPWRSSLPSSGGWGRRRPSSFAETLLPRLPLLLAGLFVVLLVLWIAGVVNGRDDDRSVAEEVDRALNRAGYPELQVVEEEGVLALVGTLDTAQDRYAAVAIARSVDGVGELDDRLEAPDAVPEEETTGSTSRPSSADDLALQAQLSGLVARDPIRFESGSTTIVDESLATLDQLAGLLSATPSVAIEIAGHTDADGDEAANQALSTQRAQAVLDALVQRGVAPERLSAAGYGETTPIASNETQEGKDRNRRIELNVLTGPVPTTTTTTTTPATPFGPSTTSTPEEPS